MISYVNADVFVRSTWASLDARSSAQQVIGFSEAVKQSGDGVDEA
ncbi:hypothetical protein RvVAR031_07380 [Agrobacterium vitis]|nr:hypothetical protein RvVAR031_07380 [Agrobacterium vitis]